MNVLFVARAIDRMAGGVERMVNAVMHALLARGHRVSLLTWDNARALSFYPMAPEISWYRLNMGDPSIKAETLLRLKRAKSIRQIIRHVQPEVIVCFQDGPFMAIRTYTMGMGIPVVAAVRNAPTRFEHTRPWTRQEFIYSAFRFAACVLIQCERYRHFYPAFLHKRIVTIPNPVFPVDGKATPGSPNQDGRFRILSVGRLGYQKNYPILIQAFAALASDFPEWDLVIVGEGEDRTALEKLASDCRLSERISMPGISNAIADYYKSSHLFCLPSRWEGFPNALAEAMPHGLPAVGFSDCSGVMDLIEDGRNGFLATGNGQSVFLVDALAKLMTSPRKRQTMGSAAVDSMKHYVPENIFTMWENTLAEAAIR